MASQAVAWPLSSSACDLPCDRERERQTGAGAFGDKVALKLGKRGKNAENELACRRSCVDSRTLTRQNS